MIPEFNVREALDSVQALVRDITNVIGLVDKNVDAWFSIQNKTSKRREVHKLSLILSRMTVISGSQFYLPNEFERIADLIDLQFSGAAKTAKIREALPLAASSAIAALEKTIDGATEMREYLESHHPDILLRRPAVYDSLIESVYIRKRLYGEALSKLMQGKSVFFQEDAKVFRSLAVECTAVVEKMRDYRRLVADILNEVENEQEASLSGKRAPTSLQKS